MKKKMVIGLVVAGFLLMALAVGLNHGLIPFSADGWGLAQNPVNLRFVMIDYDFPIDRDVRNGDTVTSEYIVTTCYDIQKKTPLVPWWRSVGMHCIDNEFNVLKRTEHKGIAK